MILAIDPGNFASGWVLMNEHTYLPVQFGKHDNDYLISYMRKNGPAIRIVVIEMVASYGMAVGREVFETCREIGRLEQAAIDLGYGVTFVYRKEEKMQICGSMKANDATIRQALVDRFAYGTPNYGKGTKKKPGWFYGFKADIWQAYAVGVTYLDKAKERSGTWTTSTSD